MFSRSICWFVCIFVAVSIATGYSGQDSFSVSDSEVTPHHLSIDNLESSAAEPVLEATRSAAVDLASLLDAGEGAVVTLVAGDTRLAAHRAVLAARSPALAAMLQDDTSDDVSLPDVEGAVLRRLLAYLYTLRAPQLPGMAAELLAAADRYGLPDLKADCERQVAALLSAETAAAAAVLAVRHSAHRLREAAVAYIRAHVTHVVRTRGWADAMRSQPLVMLEVTRLLFDSPKETSTPASADSRTTPITQPHSDHGSRSPTPAAAVSTTRSKPSISSASTNICHLCSPDPEDSGTSPYPDTQENSDRSSHKTSATSSSTMAVETIATTVDSISLLSSPDSEDSGTSPYPDTQENSDRSSHQTSDTSASTMAVETIATTVDSISLLRSLSSAEKGRRLIAAAREGALGDLEAMLAAGADVGAREKGVWRRTALHVAARGGHLAAVGRLLAAGAPLESRASWWLTPLHWAAAEGRAAVVRLLLAAGADRGATDYFGRTPLHLAADNDDARAAAALVEAGADTGAMDNKGQTPLDVARRNHRQRVIDLLQET